MKQTELKIGEIVQLNPLTTLNPMFRGCMLIVTDPKPWGAQGYVQGLGENEEIGGQYYYRAKWEEMEQTGGMTVWTLA